MPDLLTVQRVSNLCDVEFWTVAGCSRERTQLSDMFSASLVLGTRNEECGRMWMRGQDEPFRSGDILLAEPDEIQRIMPADRPSTLFTIYWQRSALEQASRESGLGGMPQWATTRLSAGPLSDDFAALRALLEAASEPEAIVRGY
ncbi:MAG TPA: hypothetical protein VJV79_26110, partial [Polyangiaceae bacterium]|nr:hypothetical protein [Polyangiaceae bacterium]